MSIPSWLSRAFIHISLAAVVINAGLFASATTVQPPHACALLSTEEIAQIVGERVRKPRPDTAQEGTACRFPMAMETLSISLWPTDAKSFDEFRKTLAASGAKLESTSGVGDVAYFWDDRIYVRVGTHGLTVWLGAPQDGSDPKRRQTVVAVAKAGVAKLR
jgi:hypothetical protein